MPHHTLDSPLGKLALVEQRGALTELRWGVAAAALTPEAPTPLLREAGRQLTAYFAGQVRDFSLPLAPRGTAYQRRLWQALRTIPYGETRSYGDIAHLLDSGPRAVGGACGRNPLPLLVPCHRVLAAGGRLGGYSGAEGLATKRFLLRLEGAAPPCFT